MNAKNHKIWDITLLLLIGFYSLPNSVFAGMNEYCKYARYSEPVNKRIQEHFDEISKFSAEFLNEPNILQADRKRDANAFKKLKKHFEKKTINLILPDFLTIHHIRLQLLDAIIDYNNFLYNASQHKTRDLVSKDKLEKSIEEKLTYMSFIISEYLREDNEIYEKYPGLCGFDHRDVSINVVLPLVLGLGFLI
jgi:hypothetical protein